MRKEIIALFEEHGTKTELRYIKREHAEFLESPDGKMYVIEDGIVRFLEDNSLIGNNKQYQGLYDRFAPFYDLTVNLYALFKAGSDRNRVIEYLSTIDVKEGDKVLEICVGTGRNIKQPSPKAQYFGVDISLGMLKRCCKTMKKLNRSITLIQAEAEAVPLKDNTFDVVFSAGGFNFFNDKATAVLEMLRLAKSGTKLMIYDETERFRSKFANSPVSGKFYKQAEIENPTKFLPNWCKEVQYKEIGGGELYVMTFRKP